MKREIYLDNNATTGLDPRVFEAMVCDLGLRPQNPSSVHAFGREARNRLTRAQRSIAEFFEIRPHELLFTSGGTEAINLVLRGLPRLSHIITSSVEHAAVAATLEVLEREGSDVTYLPPGTYGAVTPDQLSLALRPTTRLISLMAVNNETGVHSDLEGLAQVAEAAGIPLFIDGVALLGKEPFHIPHGVTFMAFSGHKIHAPKGVGALIARSSTKLTPQITGGPQQQGRRGGTENLAGILGLAKAIEQLQEGGVRPAEEMRRLRDRLERGIQARCGAVHINGEGPRVSNTSNLAFDGVEGESLLMNLDLAGVAVSHGAACSSGSLEPSRILLNMGYARERAASSVRFSLSRFTTEEEIDTVISLVADLVQLARG